MRRFICEPVMGSDDYNSQAVKLRRVTDWIEYAQSLKEGMQVHPGDLVQTKLTNGQIMTFVITNVTDSMVRFESKSCLWDGAYSTEYNKNDTNVGAYPNSHLKAHIDSMIWDLLPDDLQSVIEEVERPYETIDGRYNKYKTKLFLPAAPEVFEDEDSYGDKGLYEQLDYYKDPSHRVRGDENDFPIPYWLSSINNDHTRQAVRVSDRGEAAGATTSRLGGIVICFCISRK